MVKQVLVRVLHVGPAGARQIHQRMELLALLVLRRALQQTCTPKRRGSGLWSHTLKGGREGAWGKEYKVADRIGITGDGA